MKENKHIIECYDKTAKAYAAKFMDELTKKHLDRVLLNAFALENKHRGRCIDLGCGPGQTTRFLSECGVTQLIGTDISPGMIQTAKEISPALQFEVADLLNLPYANGSFASAIAFYAIVHFTEEQLLKAFQEIRRILILKGEFLFSFHIGDQVIHLDDFLDEKVSIDFYFFEPARIIALLEQRSFEVVDVTERLPYKEVEYPSKRAYIWVRAR